MKGLSLQKAVLFSVVLHLIVFTITILVLRESKRFVMPSPYIVSLVSPDALHKKPVSSEHVDRVVKDAVQSVAKTGMDTMPKKVSEMERQTKEDKISVLAAKKNIEKRVQLRRMISLKAGAPHPAGENAASSLQAKGDIFDDYYRKITQEIWQQWVYPDLSRKDIEAIISIKILKDGTALVQKVEKSSGNALFDRSALKALAKASPLAPPPYEMEVGVRFYP